MIEPLKNLFGESSGKMSILVSDPPQASLTLTANHDTIYVGSSIIFSGDFLQGGSPLGGKQIRLIKDGAMLTSTYTDSNGHYSMSWTADSSGSYTFWAEADDPELPPLDDNPPDTKEGTDDLPDDRTSVASTARPFRRIRRIIRRSRLFNHLVMSNSVQVTSESESKNFLDYIDEFIGRILDRVTERK